MLKVAIVGCGQIADAHLQELSKIKSASVVATCDSYRDLAMQAAMRFGVPSYYDSLQEMLHRQRPDIVHVTTPAQTHAALAQEALKSGAHVYVEKPLAVTAAEAEEVLGAARSVGLKVCVGHDQLFDPAWLHLRDRVARKEIGEVRHVESIIGYPLGAQFGSAVRASDQHWVRRLPGGLFQNTISHPLYRITEFLQDERPHVDGRWWSRPDLEFPTEMLAHFRGERVTGVLTFATSIPAQRITRVYGEKGTLEVDFDAQTVIRTSPPALPGALGKLDAPWARRRESMRAMRRNLWRFVRSDIQYFAGMRELFERFQRSIAAPEEEWPIAPTEMLRVAHIMDDIFSACRSADRTRTSLAAPPDRCCQAKSPPHDIAARSS